MKRDMAAAAERDLPPGPIGARLAGSAVMDDEGLGRETEAAAAVPLDQLLSVPAEDLLGTPVAVIASAAIAQRHQFQTAAAAAPPRRLCRHTSLPGDPARTRIQETGTPSSTAAAHSFLSSQAEPSDASKGRTQTPG